MNNDQMRVRLACYIEELFKSERRYRSAFEYAAEQRSDLKEPLNEALAFVDAAILADQRQQDDARLQEFLQFVSSVHLGMHTPEN